MKKRPEKNRLIGAWVGTIIEYYDYSLYGFSAGILASRFFPNKDHITSLIYVFAIYAAGYFSKPIGSVIFSRIGDFYGRKIALNITILGMAIPTFIIGMLPSYDKIGVLSTYILFLCRFFQGIFVAGEYDGAAIYVIEHLDLNKRYIASALTRFMGVCGLLIGTASTNFFSSSIFPAWCWRVSFLMSIPLALIAIYYRSSLTETPEFINSIAEDRIRVGFLHIIATHLKNIIFVAFVAGSCGVTYQISIIFMKQYLPITVPFTSNIIISFSTLVVLCFGLAMPISGILADKFGYLKIINYSSISAIIGSLLFIISIKYHIVNLSLVSCILLSIFVAPLNAMCHAIIIDMFKANHRYRCISLGHTTGSMLFSGTASYFCLYVIKNFNLILFPIIYLIISIVVGAVLLNINGLHGGTAKNKFFNKLR